MAEYRKPWLSIEQQVEKLASRGVDVGDRAETADLLRRVGYYRLTGYLYPLRRSEWVVAEGGASRDRELRVLSEYRLGTSTRHAQDLIDFDRALRMLVLDATERIEISLRTSIGRVLGARSAFAHLDTATFQPAFTATRIDPDSGETMPSKHDEWLLRVQERQDSSDEAFVAHFRDRYDNKMPIWALTEILELGHLSRLYGGLTNPLATQIAQLHGVPVKRLMASWIASINYVRNAAAHHARLFNRKLVVAPARPKAGDVIQLLDHLRDSDTAKARFGVYNALAVMAYLLRYVDPSCDWAQRAAGLFRIFPASDLITIASMGVPTRWETLDVWTATQ